MTNNCSITWSESDITVEQMIMGSKGDLWGNRLEQSGHYPLLKKILEDVGHQGLLIDLGCGAGDVSRIWQGEYLGADLSWVIERVAKVCNPEAKYVSLNIQNNILSTLPKCKCILMNALLDVLDNPEDILRKVCAETDSKYIIVHRQKISDRNGIKYGKSYGDSTVAVSTLSIETLKKICLDYKINQVKIFHWDGEYYSFILEIK
jgi:hypothetical protein